LTHVDGVGVWYFGVAWPRRLFYSPDMGKALARHGRDFDLFHLHSIYLWPTWAAARMARGAGVPYVLSPRGMLVQDLISRRSTLAKKLWIAAIERRNLENARAIHATSLAELAEIRRFGFSLPPVQVIPNGVASEARNHAATELPPAVIGAFRTSRPVVLYLGRINWKKGLDRLIDAMTEVNDAILLLVGSDEERYSHTLQSRARERGIGDRVLFSPPVYGPEKAELFARCSLLALASYSENFGNVVLEAMAGGCPVVVTPEVGASTIVEETGGGLVVRGEPAKLAAAIRMILDNPGQRSEMAARGRRVVDAYSWGAVAKRMLRMYHDVCREDRAPPPNG
jgi:glycosyltransferase involved in cell wall biosynthesis